MMLYEYQCRHDDCAVRFWLETERTRVNCPRCQLYVDNRLTGRTISDVAFEERKESAEVWDQQG